MSTSLPLIKLYDLPVNAYFDSVEHCLINSVDLKRHKESHIYVVYENRCSVYRHACPDCPTHVINYSGDFNLDITGRYSNIRIRYLLPFKIYEVFQKITDVG